VTLAGMSEAELKSLLELRCLPGLSERRLIELLRRHGSAEAVRGLPLSQLSPGLERRQLVPVGARVERARRLIDGGQVELLAIDCPGYPAELLELSDPPALLFGRGDLKLLGRQSVAVVGTRRPTEYGTSVTEQLVAGLVRAGVVIWSGAARGIDAIAHRTALETGGSTVAVLGSGIDVPYPREHETLLEEISRSGLVLSEFMPGEPPLPHHFPHRNRIIARLAHGVLVVEARPDGGALITADAGAASRPIMAVPGPIGRLTSMGPNRLIQEGAKLVVEAADVLEEIGGQLNAAAARGRPSARRHWKAAPSGRRGQEDPAQLRLAGDPGAGCVGDNPAPLELTGNPGATRTRPKLRPPAFPPDTVPGLVFAVFTGREAAHVDDIAVRTGLPAGVTLSALLELELAGVVEQVGGKRFRLLARPDPSRLVQPADAGPVRQ
jgi:DNA processing protein